MSAHIGICDREKANFSNTAYNNVKAKVNRSYKKLTLEIWIVFITLEEVKV